MIRYDDAERRVSLSVRDLAEPDRGELLGPKVVQSLRARASAGRAVHAAWQAERAGEDEAYRPEVTVRRTVPIGAWTVELWGRVDGVVVEGGHTVVEEVKSTALDAPRLLATVADDYPAWVAQLRIYLWMLRESGREDVVGRLVLVSLVDGCRHVLGLAHDHAATDRVVRGRLERLVDERARRVAWLARRRATPVPDPFSPWREGQREISEAVHWGLDAGRRVLVEAPTGLGKTAAALAGALRHAVARDRQVFFATARNTQQAGVVRALAAFARAGMPVRSIAIRARPKACLREVLDCRPEVCEYARDREEKLRRGGLPGALQDADRHLDADRLAEVGRAHALCPYDLALDASGGVDVVIGDYNYVLDPGARIERHFGAERGGEWIVIADEVHQLAERARDWYSPRLEAGLAREAAHHLWLLGPRYAPWIGIAQRAESLLVRVARGPSTRSSGELAVVEAPREALRELVDEVDRRALDYAHLRIGAPDGDPFTELAWRLLALGPALDAEDLTPIATTTPGREALALVCLDPSGRLGASIAPLGGFVGLSATLSPPEHHRDALGLDPERLDVVRVPSPFPPENRRVLIAPRISTAWKDRADHAPNTARLLEAAVAATPGNVAIYFPSFQMLEDLRGRCAFPDREVVVQRPGMDDALREAALSALGRPGPPRVLLAVLGGVFAEGIDLPPGALAAVIVVSPALPPVGLERDLLRERLEARTGRGFYYASLVPGLTRVVQAAGRLHRRPEDRGVILLVDRRFRWREVRALLPEGWAPSIEVDPVPAIREFFHTAPPGAGDSGG